MTRANTTWIWLVLSLGSIVSWGDDPAAEGKEKTIQGILVDTKCYGLDSRNKGQDHITPKGKVPNCASASAKLGIPVGVLIAGKKGGDVVFLVVPASQLAAHMGKQVKVTGKTPYPLGMIPTLIQVKDGEEWVEVKLAMMK